MSRDSICSSSKSCRESTSPQQHLSWPSKDHLPRSSNSHEVLRYSLLTTSLSDCSQKSFKRIRKESSLSHLSLFLLLVVDNCMWLRNEENELEEEEKNDKRFKTTTGKWYVCAKNIMQRHFWGQYELARFLWAKRAKLTLCFFPKLSKGSKRYKKVQKGTKKYKKVQKSTKR